MSDSQPSPSYDVLLHASIKTRMGPANRWFIAGSHTSRPHARMQYQELCQEFPDPRVILLLAMNAYDPETSRFHDRIIDARGRAPLIDRKQLEQLTPVVKKQISEGPDWNTAPARPVPPPAGPGLGWWLAGGSAALAVVVLSLLR